MEQQIIEKIGKIKVELLVYDFYRRAKITPDGFWTDVVMVSQRDDIRDKGTMCKPTISWSSGGNDGTLTGIERVGNFVLALQKAIEICEEWSKEGKCQ